MGEEDVSVTLVDEPIGGLVARLQLEDPEIAALVGAPRRQLAFRTFASIRAGLVLGQLLVELDAAAEESQTWVDQILADEASYARIAAEVKTVAREVAADPELAEEEIGPDAEARERFREFARTSLRASSASTIDRKSR